MNRDGAFFIEDDLMGLMVGDRALEGYRNSHWFDELRSGFLIACTNRVNAVDPALRRRFHKHITCGPIGHAARVRPGTLAHLDVFSREEHSCGMAMSSETIGGTFDIDAARASYQKRRSARQQALYERWALARSDADKIIEGIREGWHPNRIVIWGSLLRPDRFTENSDIDIAVEGVNDMERWSEMEAWALGQTDISLDLIPLEKIHPEHRSRILETGSVVYEREKRCG